MAGDTSTGLTVSMAVLLVIALLSVGTVMYTALEGWPAIDSFYFTAITLTTIGYGDLTPTHEISKLFTVFFAFSGVGLVIFSLSIITNHYMKQQVVHLERRVKRMTHHQKDGAKKS